MLSLLVWSNLAILQSSSKDRLEDSARNISIQYAQTAARFLFEADLAGLDEYSRQAIQHQEVAYISVFDRQDRKVYELGDVANKDSFRPDERIVDVDDGVFDLVHRLKLGETHVGKARMGFSLNLLNHRVEQAWIRGLSIAAAEIALTIIVGLFIGKALTRNLRDLATGAKAYGAGEKNIQIPVRSGDEVGQAALAFNQMVADRNYAESLLRESEQQFHAIVEHTPDLILLTDANGKIIFSSPSSDALLGVSAPALVSKDVSSIAREADRQILRDELNKALANDHMVHRFEFQAQLPSGSMAVFEAIVRSYVNNPDVGSVVLLCRDITERQKIEAQLRQSQKMEAIGNLTGGVAHDFNNLLAVILGNLELIEDDKDPALLSERIDEAMKATMRGAELTRKMLSYGRRAHLEPVALNLNEVISEFQGMLRRTLSERIRLEISQSRNEKELSDISRL